MYTPAPEGISLKLFIHSYVKHAWHQWNIAGLKFDCFKKIMILFASPFLKKAKLVCLVMHLQWKGSLY